MKQVKSLKSLQNEIGTLEKSFLLLYKKGSSISDCAFDNINTALAQIKGLHFFFADVSVTRDIHPHYNITTVPTLVEFSKNTVKNLYKGCSEVNVYKNLFDETIYFEEAKAKGSIQKSVTVYSTPTCTWCNTLKSYLRQKRVLFTDIDVSRDQHAADELVRRSGQMGVPQTEIEGEIIVGFNKARINELLSIKG